MMYLKLSIRNAMRSFINYLLYVVTMTILLAMIEISNCITIIGEAAGFQVISLPLLITVIQIVLVGYMVLFLLKQRAKEFASYLLLGMGKSDQQIAGLVNRQIAIRLTAPMVMAFLIILFCIPLLNGKINFLLPASLHHILLKLTGEFGACIVVFYKCNCKPCKKYARITHSHFSP